MHEPQAHEAAGLIVLTKPAGLSLGDRACLALATTLDLPVVTADRAWSRVGLSLQISLIR
jgi:PIN domain nuclease of toxin-antitoxin system